MTKCPKCGGNPVPSIVPDELGGLLHTIYSHCENCEEDMGMIEPAPVLHPLAMEWLRSTKLHAAQMGQHFFGDGTTNPVTEVIDSIIAVLEDRT